MTCGVRGTAATGRPRCKKSPIPFILIICSIITFILFGTGFRCIAEELGSFPFCSACIVCLNLLILF